MELNLLEQLLDDELYGAYMAAKRRCFALSSSQGYNGNVDYSEYQEAKDERDRAMVLLLGRGIRV